MPTYEYRCPEGHTFDRFAKMSDSAAELPCPTCGRTAVRQVSGGAGLVFKGSGFYLTDYGKNAHRTGTDGKSAASGAKHEGEAGGGESAGADTKSGETRSSDAKSASSDAASPAAAGAAAAKSGSEAAKPVTSPVDAKSSSKKPKK